MGSKLLWPREKLDVKLSDIKMADIKMADLKMADFKMASSIPSVSTLDLFREGQSLLGCSMPCFSEGRKKKTVACRFGEAAHNFGWGVIPPPFN